MSYQALPWREDSIFFLTVTSCTGSCMYLALPRDKHADDITKGSKPRTKLRPRFFVFRLSRCRINASPGCVMSLTVSNKRCGTRLRRIPIQLQDVGSCRSGMCSLACRSPKPAANMSHKIVFPTLTSRKQSSYGGFRR